VVALRDTREDELKQLNSFSVMLGLVAFLISIFAAFPLSWFFRSPKLPPVVITMSIAFVITSFKVVPAALLERDLRFKTLSVNDGIRAVTLAAAMIIFAFAGFRYWTLVFGGILSSVMSTLLILRVSRVGFHFPRFASLRKSLTFSWHILGGRLSWYVYLNSDFAVAGRTLGQVALGNYTLAWTLANIPLQSLSNLVSSVTPGFFSFVQKDRAELRRYLLNLTEGLALITFPLTVGLALVARDFVLVFLGSKWLPIVMPLQLLAAYASVRGVTPLLAPVLNVTGEARFNMRLGVLSAILFPLGFLVGSRWGTVGIAGAWLIVHPITISLVFRRTFQKVGCTTWEYLKVLRPAVEGSVFMGIAVLAVRYPLHAYGSHPLLSLASEVLVGGIAYVGLVMTLHRHRIDAIHKRYRQARAS
jgi:PST family polysaccharide transporter